MSKQCLDWKTAMDRKYLPTHPLYPGRLLWWGGVGFLFETVFASTKFYNSYAEIIQSTNSHVHVAYVWEKKFCIICKIIILSNISTHKRVTLRYTETQSLTINWEFHSDTTDYFTPLRMRAG